MVGLKTVWIFTQGGIWIPDDGVVGPNDVAMAMAKKAKEMGKII